MKNTILFPLALFVLMLISFVAAPRSHSANAKSSFSQADSIVEGEILTKITLVEGEDLKCSRVHVLVQEMRKGNLWYLASGEVTVGEDCGYTDLMGDIEQDMFVETTLESVITENIEVSYAIKKWYYDFLLKQKIKTKK